MSVGSKNSIVLWEINGTLGFTEKDPEGQASDLLLFPDISDVLRDLQSTAIRSGVKATCGVWTPERLLAKLGEVGVDGYFDAQLGVPFECSASAMSADVKTSGVLVSAKHTRRWSALRAGMAAVPHRALAKEVCDGGILTYIAVSGRVPQPSNDGASHAVLPLYRPTRDVSAFYAISTLAGAEWLRRKGYRVETFGPENEPASTELYVVRLDGSRETKAYITRVKDQGNTVQVLHDRLIFALRPDQSLSLFHPPGRVHGHTLLLQPTDVLIEPAQEEAHATVVAMNAAAAPCTLPVLATGTLDAGDKSVIMATITPELIAENLACWCGEEPLPGTEHFVTSRHIDHPDNRLVTTALRDKLAAIVDYAVLDPIDYADAANVEGRMYGTEPSEILIVGAHLDSCSSEGNAPGADDDASGIAGVLAVAQALKAINKTPRREIRFVLFNGEESGMRGSKSYAEKLTTTAMGKKRKPVAMIQMDMIGTAFGQGVGKAKLLQAEIHPGGDLDFAGIDDCVRQRTHELAALIASEGTPLTEAITFETFPREDETTDPLGSSSDHHRLLVLAKCPACLVTENAFNAVTKNISALNTSYHTKDDTFDKVVPDYAARIARAVAAAVWVMANS